MKKHPIGILDLGLNNISILNTFASNFEFEDFLYINDFEVEEYEGLDLLIIEERIQKHVEFLLSKHVKLIVVVSNTIVEYYKQYFNDLPVPVINVVDTIVQHVNDFYEHKNMVFLAQDNIMKANMYQKNFRYNHLYNVVSDRLLEIVKLGRMKTNESFMATKEAFKLLSKKDVDIIIPSNVNLMLLTTEINEYVKDTDVLELSKLFVEKVKAALLAIENFYQKKKGKVLIGLMPQNYNLAFRHLVCVKYKIIKIKSSKL